MFITLDTLQKDECKINSVNRLYLLVDEIDGFIESSSTEENNGNKYLNTAFTDSNSKVIKKICRNWEWN